MKINSLYSYFIALSLFFSIGLLASCGSKTGDETATDSTAIEILDTNQESPTKFATLDEMMVDLGDYSIDNNTYEKTADTKIRISPSVAASADEIQTQQIVKASLVSIALRTFIHTDLAEITIKVIPQKATMNPEDAKMMEKYTQEATVTRQKAEEVVKQYTGGTLNALVGNKIGELFRPDMPNDNMEKIRGTENLDAVFTALTAK